MDRQRYNVQGASPPLHISFMDDRRVYGQQDLFDHKKDHDGTTLWPMSAPLPDLSMSSGYAHLPQAGTAINQRVAMTLTHKRSTSSSMTTTAPVSSLASPHSPHELHALDWSAMPSADLLRRESTTLALARRAREQQREKEVEAVVRHMLPKWMVDEEDVDVVGGTSGVEAGASPGMFDMMIGGRRVYNHGQLASATAGVHHELQQQLYAPAYGGQIYQQEQQTLQTRQHYAHALPTPRRGNVPPPVQVQPTAPAYRSMPETPVSGVPPIFGADGYCGSVSVQQHHVQQQLLHSGSPQHAQHQQQHSGSLQHQQHMQQQRRRRNTTEPRELKHVTLYKTELCRIFEETNRCAYGDRCHFAHTIAELRTVQRHARYKTEVCRTFWEKGTCPYGKRCCFIHAERVDEGQGGAGNGMMPTATTPVRKTSRFVELMRKQQGSHQTTPTTPTPTPLHKRQH